MIFIYTLKNREFFQCSVEERVSCLDIIDTITHLAETLSKKPLSVEDIYNIEDDFLARGIGLIYDEIEPDTIKEFMEIEIITSGKRGVEALKMLIILKGVLAIQSKKMRPNWIRRMLELFIGRDAFNYAYEKEHQLKASEALKEKRENELKIIQLEHAVNNRNKVIDSLGNFIAPLT